MGVFWFSYAEPSRELRWFKVAESGGIRPWKTLVCAF